jgi:elongation factor P
VFSFTGGIVLTTADFRKGLRVLLDGEPYTLLDVQVQMPSARGANTLVKVKARNVLSGQMVDRTFKAGEKFQEPDLAFRTARLLYQDNSAIHFMDDESYEQFSLAKEEIGSQAIWLAEEMEVRSIRFNGRVVGIEVPQFVTCQVESVEPGSRGDTATGRVLKNAVLANGLTARVPLYVTAGETIRVDTSTGEFVERVAR